jgi:hypothetical protein
MGFFLLSALLLLLNRVLSTLGMDPVTDAWMLLGEYDDDDDTKAEP